MPRAAKLGRILAGYAENLSAEERDLLVRLSVFPRGVTVDILAYLVDAGGEIAGALVGLQQAKLIRLAERLHHQGLVYTYKRQNLLTYTAHPFLREYFRDLLGVPQEKMHEAVRRKLAVGLDSKPKTKPRRPEILDRYESLIEHSILAGHVKEACDLFKNALGGGGGSEHLYHTVGDYGRIIRLLSLFSADGEPQDIVPQLPLKDRSYLINYWGLAAGTLGDLNTEERCFDVSNELDRNSKDWKNLSQGLQNSAFITLARGAFPSAQTHLKESFEYAEEDDKYIRRYSHSFLAATCHAMGKSRMPEKILKKQLK